MKILMLGWELAPFISGGLGVAVAGLAEALAERGHQLTLALPYQVPITAPLPFKVVFLAERRPTHAPSSYATASVAGNENMSTDQKSEVVASMFDEVYLFARRLRRLLGKLDFDVIHAHDWLNIPAGLMVQATGKPLVLHMHSTEFYRTGGLGANEQVYKLEQKGLQRADRVVVISNHVKEVITREYETESTRIRVVHNGISWQAWRSTPQDIVVLKRDYNIVLSLGRVTIQKGLDYLLDAARLVCDRLSDTLFVIAGSGDMREQLMNQAISSGLAGKVIFTGWVSKEEAAKYYAAADLFLMPSIAEPFGLVALEAVLCETPIIISKTSGLTDIFKHCLQVDFWDVELLASHIISVLEHQPLKEEMIRNGLQSACEITWGKAAEKVEKVYEELI